MVLILFCENGVSENVDRVKIKRQSASVNYFFNLSGQEGFNQRSTTLFGELFLHQVCNGQVEHTQPKG